MGSVQNFSHVEGVEMKKKLSIATFVLGLLLCVATFVTTIIIPICSMITNGIRWFIILPISVLCIAICGGLQGLVMWISVKIGDKIYDKS